MTGIKEDPKIRSSQRSDDRESKEEQKEMTEAFGYLCRFDMYLNQIVLVGGIPFALTLPNAPESIDATRMSDEQIHAKIQRGYESYKAGRTQNAAEAFNKSRENHS